MLKLCSVSMIAFQRWGLRDGCVGENGPKRWYMRRLGHRWVFFLLFYCFFCVIKLNPVSMNALQQRKDLGMAAFEKTGPNDAICVVWATSEFFFFFYWIFCILKLHTASIYLLQNWVDLRMAVLEKMGPNDSLWVVWAICFVFVYFFIFYFLSLFFIFLKIHLKQSM